MRDWSRKLLPNDTKYSIFGAGTTLLTAVLLGCILFYLLMVPNTTVRSARSEGGLRSLRYESRVELPEADAPLGTVTHYTFLLPEISTHDPHLIFYVTHQYARVFIGDEEVYALEYPESNRFGRTFGDGWVQVPLYPEDSAKVLSVDLMPVYETSRDTVPEFLVGSLLSAFIRQLKQELPQIFLSILTVLTGVMYVAVGVFMNRRRKTYESVIMLGLFSILMGTWKLTDCIIAAYIFQRKTALLHYTALSCLLLAPMPLVRFVRISQKDRHIMERYGILLSSVTLLQTLLQLLGIFDLRQMLSVTHGMILVGSVAIMVSHLRNRVYWENRSSEMRKLQLLFLCIIGAVADVVLFNVTGTSSGLFFSLLAFLIYVGCAGMFSLQDIMDQEKELTDRRIAVMMSQIQPHFIYNTLGTIRYLCMTDPEKAAQVVQEFSLYLRGNFGELTNYVPIRISRELEHVRHYAAIEKIRFPDIEITYDLRSGEFFLPALSVQPLVENAIKHGLMKLESGGKVEIATYETETCYCVRVVDNGVGFDTAAQMDTSRHIGIQNIRGRLQAMCGGSLTIESTPGQGTVALIRIPKEENL